MCDLGAEIRAFISDLIGQGRIADELSGPLKIMRRYSVRFLERVGAVERPEGAKRHLFREPDWQMNDYWFGEALGELRSGIGMQVAIIAASFGLDVDDDLAQTLPAPDHGP